MSPGTSCGLGRAARSHGGPASGSCAACPPMMQGGQRAAIGAGWQAVCGHAMAEGTMPHGDLALQRQPCCSLPEPQPCGRARGESWKDTGDRPFHSEGQGAIPRSHRIRCLRRNAGSPSWLVLTHPKRLSVPAPRSRPLPTELVPHACSPASPAAPLVGVTCRMGPCAQSSHVPHTTGPLCPVQPCPTHNKSRAHSSHDPHRLGAPHLV